MDRIRIALAGAGQIVRDQHVPVLTDSPSFDLVGAVSPFEPLAGWPNYADIDELIAARPDVQAVAVCTPPQVRVEVAQRALRKGLHVMLEKPPCPTLAAADALVASARKSNVALFAAWHSRAAPAVAVARDRLAGRAIESVSIVWREDIRVFHPGQTWLWEDGGFGVFDPGINALSIVTSILPGSIGLDHADLSYPSNCANPIAATLQMSGEHGESISAEFDFLAPEPATWEISIDSDADHLVLSQGGAALHVDGKPAFATTESDNADLHAEYTNLYARFAALIGECAIDVDCEPLRLVLEALAGGTRHEAEEFYPDR